jgi:signal transduction histidine kinase
MKAQMERNTFSTPPSSTGFLQQSSCRPLNDPSPDRGPSQEFELSIIELLEDTFLSCQTAAEILNDILSYDKLEASDMKLNHSVIDVKTLLERCVTPFHVQVDDPPILSLAHFV